MPPTPGGLLEACWKLSRAPSRPSPKPRRLTSTWRSSRPGHSPAPPARTKDGGSAHAPWLSPALLPAAALWSAAFTAWARAGALRHGRLCGARRGARRAAGGRGGSHDPARRGGSGSARCVRGLAGPQPAQRLPRAIPAPLRSRGVRTEGLRGHRGGREGGCAAVVPRPPAERRHGRGRAEATGPRRALAREAARAWTGRGTGERPRGGACEARSLPLPLGRVGVHSADPGGKDGSGPAGGEESPSHARDEDLLEFCRRPTLLLERGRLGLWVGFLLFTSGKPITPGNAVYCDRGVIVLSVDWSGSLKTRVSRSCVK